MRSAEGRFLYYVQRIFKVFLRLAREAYDDIRCDAKERVVVPEHEHDIQILLACVVAVHGFEHGVAAVLHGKVQMMAQPSVPDYFFFFALGSSLFPAISFAICSMMRFFR